MSRYDPLELAAALVGLVACLTLLVPAALQPARDLPPVFGTAQLGQVPVVALAALWLIVVLVARSRAPGADPRARQNVSTYLLLPALLSLGVVIHQLRSLPSLKGLHPPTAVLYFCLVEIAVVSALREIAPLRELPHRAWTDVRRAGGRGWAALTALAAAAVAAVVLIPRPPADASGWPSMAEFEQWYARQERGDLPGDGQAAVTVVKFHDYQCPPCRRSFTEQPSLNRRADPRSIAYVTRDYPLDAECNPHVERSLHPLACEAAVAVRLAARGRRDEAMAAWLFAHQAELSKEAIVEAARQVGGVEDFQTAYAAALEDVRADVALGHRLGVHATPTLFVNGIRIGSMPKAYLEAAIAYELRRRGPS